MVTPSLYLLVGKEDFLKKEFIRKLKTSVFPNPSGSDLNFQEFDARSDASGAFKDFLQTAPFLSDKRLGVLSGIDELSGEAREALLSFVASFPPTAVGVLVSDESSAKKNSFLSALSQKAKTVPCYAPFDRDLPHWVESRARQAGLRLGPAASQLLIDKIGKDVPALSSAVEMLALYLHPRNEAGVQEVERLIGSSLQNDVFLLVDVLLKKDAKAALTMTGRFLNEGIRGFEIVSVLAGQFERLRKGQLLAKQGVPEPQVGAELKVHPYFLEKFLAQVRALSRLDVRKVFGELLSCDESIKTGALEESLAVERLVLSLCL